MKKQLVIIYYSFLGIFLAYQSIKTVANLSQSISYGNRMALLEREKQTLTSKSNQLESQLSCEFSLTKLATNDTLVVDFKPISKPLIVDLTHALASR